MRRLALCWIPLWLGLLSATASAHPLAPALLELREQQSGAYDVLWRSSLARVTGSAPRPRLPASCEFAGTIVSQDLDGARSERWPIRCHGSLVDQVLQVEGLDGSGINVIVRVVDTEGRVQQGLLGERDTAYRVRTAQDPPPVFSGYLSLGIGHLLFGFDHVLFVVGLVLLIRRPKALLLTVTAFTLGHSLTLGLSALKLLWVPQALTEFAIAVSILLLACELVRPPEAPAGWIRRRPGAMAVAFGLLHGLGFAGALAEIGLPEGEIPLALFAFNLGIELGQLLLVVVLLGVLALLDRVSKAHEPLLSRALPAYLIGSLAAYWCLDRAGGLFSA